MTVSVDIVGLVECLVSMDDEKFMCNEICNL